ncbi:MAG: phage late control D family protein [Deltaproteobacteria bacterium]|nr:phage late control D family protein [Deltaproteobacteria bacterium]
MGAAAPNVDIFLNGEEIPDGDFISYLVERDMFQPDMAAIVLSNKNDIYGGKFKIGQPVEVKVGSPPVSIYKGEIVGFEGVYKGGDTTKLLIRAMNKMHRLLRKRKSITYTEKTDKEIIQQICGDAELTLEFEHREAAGLKYKHVYQHNQTNLEFVRTRAARMGCHVWCVDTKLFVKEPDLGKTGKLKLNVDKDGTLRVFTPRMSSATVVKKVTVKGWNPETMELIEGKSDALPTQLGAEDAVKASGALGKEETFTVDHPIWSLQEANMLAKARVRDLNLQFLTGEAECAGNSEVQLGEVVEITANALKADDPFNGKYYVMGITHRHTMPKAKEGGFVTILKLARDAQKGGS